MSRPAGAWIALLGLALGGCASHPPEPLAALPELRARAVDPPPPVPLVVAFSVERGPRPQEAASREGEPAAHVDVDTAALQRGLQELLDSQRVFERAVAVEGPRALETAFDARADLLLRLRVDRAVVRFAGLNGGLYAINWLNWFMFWFPSWWVADERYALEIDATLEVTGVRSERVLFARGVHARVERSLDDLDRGLAFLGLPYFPGALDEDNLREAAGVLAPYARNRLLVDTLVKIDEDLRRLVVSGALQQRDATSFALLAGISRYRHYALHNVRFAADDARLVRMTLLESGAGRGLPAKNVTMLLDEQATAAAFDAALQRWLEWAREVDRLVVYFAGYARPGPDGDVLLLPHDHDPEAGAPAISLRELHLRLAAAKAGAVVLVVDAGLGGGAAGRSAGALDEGSESSWQSVWGPNPPGRLLVLAAAGSDGEGAFELHDAGHGLFTFHLVQALRREGSEGWAEALRAAREEVVRHAALEGVRQRPSLLGAIEDLEALERKEDGGESQR